MRLLSRLVGLLPARWLSGLGAALGWLAFSVLRVRRRVTLDNLHRALGLPPGECVEVAARVYRHLCTGALELLRVHRMSRLQAEEVLGAEGAGRLRAHLAAGRGVLVLGAHLGQWDLLACAAARCGFTVNVVTRDIKATWLNRYWMEQRQACGVRLLPASGSARAIVAALRRNEMVALVLDQHEPGGAIIPFFERPAATATGLARLALGTKAPVVPVFLLREGAGFRLLVEEPVQLRPTGDRQRDVLDGTARLAQVVEAQVRACPDQWLWLHRRWKVHPPARPTELQS